MAEPVEPEEIDGDPESVPGLDNDATRIEAEEQAAARRRSSIEAGRRKGGLLGAAAAGALLGLRDVYEGPRKDDEIVIVSETPGGPGDIDTDGIAGSVDDVDFWAPPPGPPLRQPGVENPSA